jgi:hypothetical protein
VAQELVDAHKQWQQDVAAARERKAAWREQEEAQGRGGRGGGGGGGGGRGGRGGGGGGWRGKGRR